jgi:myo-inositol 2-dehydrogenase/D-chiro-inositol 1-dehydrogenase
MRFGLIGFGAWGQLHASAMQRIADIELTAICCRSDAAAGIAKETYPDAVIYRDWQSLVEANDVEAVSIVVPNHLHAEISVAALNAGKDVQVEKPMATTVEDCDRMIAAAQANDRVLSIGHELRFSSQWGTVKTLLDDNALGAPRYVNMSLFRFPFRQGSEGWRYNAGEVGSWLLEEPVHYFDLIAWYFERWAEPVAVRAISSGQEMASGEGQGLVKNLSVWVRFSNGGYATITLSLSGFENHLSFEMAGDSGSLRTWWSGVMDRTYEPKFELKVQRSNETTVEQVPLAASGEVFELDEQLRHVVVALRERRALVSGQTARKAVALCVAAQRSVLEGREIALNAAV